jgi:integrase
MLISWLFNEEVLQEYPTCLQRKSNKYSFLVPLQKPKTISLEWVQKLLNDANPRMKLFILLTLNCGFGASEIGQLSAEEYDPKTGRITHKRHKTENYGNVPTVCYKLWHETQALLDTEIANGKKHPKSAQFLLVNKNGEPLWSEYVTEGKSRRSSNIASAFKRLMKKLREDDPSVPAITYYQFRKTSASLLRNEPKHTSLVGIFLGHSPKSMADRHYNALDDTILDECLAWLHDKYFGLADSTSASEKEDGK